MVGFEGFSCAGHDDPCGSFPGYCVTPWFYETFRVSHAGHVQIIFCAVSISILINKSLEAIKAHKT